MFDQPIIERKSSSPLATSLLVLSAVCLLTAIVLVGAKIKDQTVVGAEKPTDSAQTWYNKGPKKAIKNLEEIVGE
ncbi:MAG: hypothetical protein ACO4B4_11670 [Planctomycetota bacterium]|jgi:hypothetical protein